MNLSFEIFLAALRHGLTGLGLIITNSGLAERNEVEGAVGSVAVLVGFGWSVYRKWSRRNDVVLPPPTGPKLPLLLVLLALCPLLFAPSGCTSTNATAYKSIGTIEATVDHAMSAWADYVVWKRAQMPGGADAELTKQEGKVKTAYTVYRQAANTFYDIRSAAAIGGANPPDLSGAAQASIDLVAVVNSFLPTDKQLK